MNTSITWIGSFAWRARLGRLLLAWATLCSVAAHAAGNRLQSVDAATAGDGRVNIRLHLADYAPEPSVFTVNDPARVAIDLPATRLGNAKHYQSIDEGPVKAVAAAAGQGRTRVIIELKQMVDYQVHRRGHEIVVSLAGSDRRSHTRTAAAERLDTRARTRGNAEPAAASGRDATSAEPASGAPAVRDIDFRRGKNGAGRVIVSLGGGHRPADVGQDNGQVIARLAGVSLPPRLRKRYDVRDFATPVSTIDATMRAGAARIAITPRQGADYERVAYQTGNRFIVELQPVGADQRSQTQTKPHYTGQKISLSFQNIDVRAVLQIIADVADVNLVVSDSVSGKIALRLEDVPWDQALDIILRAKNLGMRRQGNVISVAPLAQIAAREQAEQAARQASANLAPLHSDIIQINYAQAANIAALLRSGTDEKNAVSLLSSRGQVTVDARTNSLLVNDTRQKIDDIRQLIHRLDIPVRQVLIQARIVVANRNFSRSLGVSQAVNETSTIKSSGNNFTADSGFTVNLPVVNPAGTISTSIVGNALDLNLALSAMESENRGQVISSPRVITADGTEAQIEQGEEIPYRESTGQGNATTSFKKAVLSLQVTPKITPDNHVIMNLDVTNDSRGDPTGTSVGQQPAINRRNLTTQVLVDDGETVVLGGIYQQTNRDRNNRIPILGELPLIGGLFRGTNKVRNKQELLLFITPKILRQTLTAR